MSETRYRKYLVTVTIENKAYIDDPEGRTIHKDLLLKNSYNEIISVRTAKMLKITLQAKSCGDAENLIDQLCKELMIFNPVVSNCRISCEGYIEEE